MNYQPAKPLTPELQRAVNQITTLIDAMKLSMDDKRRASMRAYLHYLDITQSMRKIRHGVVAVKKPKQDTVTANK